jgi:hypothetical protein
MNFYTLCYNYNSNVSRFHCIFNSKFYFTFSNIQSGHYEHNFSQTKFSSLTKISTFSALVNVRAPAFLCVLGSFIEYTCILVSIFSFFSYLLLRWVRIKNIYLFFLGFLPLCTLWNAVSIWKSATYSRLLRSIFCFLYSTCQIICMYIVICCFRVSFVG